MLTSRSLVERYNKPGPRYTSYPTALEFEPLTIADAEDAMRRSRQAGGPLSVYVHLPFCQSRCLYCACNAIINPDGRAAAPYLDRLRREISVVGHGIGPGRQTTQLHFGGGTPTFYSADDLRGLFGDLRAVFSLSPDAEVAIELDPRVTTHEHLETLAECGINRISLGVQSFDSKVQETVNRVQSLNETRGLVDKARDLGITAVNVDLIYGLPHQTVDSFRETLFAALELGPPNRFAVYSFAYLPSLKGHQRKLPADAIPQGADKLALADVAKEILLDAGYVAIGLDHYALPDDDLCIAQQEGRLFRNFMGYTTRKAPEMVGLGLSAIGYIGDAFVQNTRHLKTYQDAIDAGRLPIERGRITTPDDRLRAHIIREIMCNFRLDKRDLERTFDVRFDETFGHALQSRLDTMIDDGLLLDTSDAIEVTPTGRAFVRNIAMLFDAYRTVNNDDALSSTV